MEIAIIGTGISGLAAGYILNPHHNITVYEKNPYLGGHSRTVEVKTESKSIPVDTGFIVFNNRNYPLLSGLFKHLDVKVQKTEMSFGTSIENGWLEYATRSNSTMFAQKLNLIRPSFWKMIVDIFRFNNKAKRYLDADSTVSLGDCLDELKMGDWFRRYYLLAMGGAIWSCPLETMLEFPASSFVRFFENHGLLSINDQPQWYSVCGGSREYVNKLSQPFQDKIRLNCGVQKVVRENNKVTVIDTNNKQQQFDHVIFASHADQSLAMLDSADSEEQDILSSFKYQPNKIVLHSDTSFMPKRRKCWASWVYLNNQKHDKRSAISLSYWMNSLQNLDQNPPIIVTLNPSEQHYPKADTIHDEYVFEHPIFDQQAIDAQERIRYLQGHRNSWYCGAYQRHGFHEDGLLSAVEVVNKMGIDIPWK